MKKEVEIIIRSSQVLDGESDEMELSTLGKFYEKDGSHYLSYEETEVTGLEGHSTILKLGPGKVVTMNRYGRAASKLLIEEGECNSCLYNTEFGSMTLDVRGRQHELYINEDDGRLFMAYTIDLGGGAVSYNEIELKWKTVKNI